MYCESENARVPIYLPNTVFKGMITFIQHIQITIDIFSLKTLFGLIYSYYFILPQDIVPTQI
jgi:hypothetical protein